MALKEVGLYWGQTRTASCHLLLMAVKRGLLPLMDVTPPNLAPVIQVRDSCRLLGYHKKLWRNFISFLSDFCLPIIFTSSAVPHYADLWLLFSCTEPSTSRASLNFQDYVLSRPPLSRSHLHFPPLDASSPILGASSSIFSQPSTSSAPGPFSTGFSLVKEIKDNLSQHEDDNISTTSGFSSRASDKGKGRE